ncbi:MAG: hypothetical protein IPK82_07035 [Polyangiaceae bacterium]|nr:hypothetical protein [Polyangiaceae bacterium]
MLNFTPAAQGGLPVAGWVLTAMHAFAFGARRCVGRALAVHSDDPDLTLLFARAAVEFNRLQASLASVAAEGKYPDAKAGQTLVIATLRDAFRKRVEGERNHRPASLTVYHLTNSGQGPDISLYELDGRVVRFLARAESARFRNEWNALVAQAWRREKVVEGKGKAKSERFITPAAPDPAVIKNTLYDDLFQLPLQVSRFVKTHFLGRVDEALHKNREDPRTQKRLRALQSTHKWPLVELFLEEIVAMDKARIETLRTVGDRIAARIQRGDRDLLRSLLQASKYAGLRTRLIKSSALEVKAGRQPLLTFDEFIQIFEEAEDVPYRDWSLARDLLCLRVLEGLRDYFAANAEAAAELGAPSDDDSQDAHEAEQGASA